MNNFSFGAVKSEPDSRDWKWSVIRQNQLSRNKIKSVNDLPSTYDLRKHLLDIRNQGKQGACVAFTMACMKEYQEYKDNKLSEYMSPQFLYNLRSEYPREGMQGRNAMQILQEKGIATEKIFKYNDNNLTPSTVHPAALEQALNFRIKNYALVESTTDLKTAIYENGPCYIALPAYNGSKTFWKPKELGQEQKGGHAVAVVGWNNVGFILRNSWGVKWGDNGYTVFPFTDWGIQWEVWTSVDLASNKIEDLNYEVIDNDQHNQPDPKKKCCSIL